MAEQKQTAGYDRRLMLALDAGPRPMSVRELARKLGEKHRGLRGTSYGGVRQYAEGAVLNPRTDLLRAMADVLDVRADWLAWDEGPMTEEELRRAEATRAATPKLSLADVLLDKVEAFSRFSPVVQAAVVHVAFRWAAAEHPRFREGLDMTAPLDERALEAGEEVVRALLAPLDAWGMTWEQWHSVDLSGDRYDDYCLAMLNALALSTPRVDEAGASLAEWTPGPAGRPLSDPDEVEEINRRVREVRRKGGAAPKPKKKPAQKGAR